MVTICGATTILEISKKTNINILVIY